MLDIAQVLKDLLTYIGPLAIIVFGILIAWGTIKWLKRLGVAINGLSENPGYIVFALLVIAGGLYFWFNYIAPLFK